MNDVYKNLKKLSLSDSFIYHLKLFLLENDIYTQFCRAVEISRPLTFMLKNKDYFTTPHSYCDFFNSVFLWSEHYGYINFKHYHDKWEIRCKKLLHLGKIKFNR